MDFVSPTYQAQAFNCPRCSAYAHMNWYRLAAVGGTGAGTGMLMAVCAKCARPSFWLVSGERMIEPEITSAPPPAADMPEDVRTDYVEAASVANRSPRAAAALLRLALQRLCVHLGEKGKNIDDDIRALAKKNVLPAQLINVADTMRITGNNAVHPGEMDPRDVDLVASKMFLMLNLIVVKAISEPRELQNLYELTPLGARNAAEQKDQSASKQ